VLKEHLTKKPALFVCFKRNVLFENEKEIKLPGDYFLTEEMMKHCVKGITDSFFIILK
jgi:hypothetical protein